MFVYCRLLYVCVCMCVLEGTLLGHYITDVVSHYHCVVAPAAQPLITPQVISVSAVRIGTSFQPSLHSTSGLPACPPPAALLLIVLSRGEEE